MRECKHSQVMFRHDYLTLCWYKKLKNSNFFKKTEKILKKSQIDIACDDFLNQIRRLRSPGNVFPDVWYLGTKSESITSWTAFSIDSLNSENAFNLSPDKTLFPKACWSFRCIVLGKTWCHSVLERTRKNCFKKRYRYGQPNDKFVLETY